MIVDDQHAAGLRLFKEIQCRFPEAKLINIGPGPEDPEMTVVDIASLADEQREEELRTFAAERATDILLETDAFIVVVPGYFDVVIELPDAYWGSDPGKKAHYHQVRDEIVEFVEQSCAGEESSWSEGMRGGLYVGLRLRDLDFAKHDLIEKLRSLGVLGDTIVYWKHPYSSPLTGRQTQLHPPGSGSR